VGCSKRQLQQHKIYDAIDCLPHGKIWTPNAHSTLKGCVTDRDQNFDTTNTAPTAGSTLNPAEQYSSCPAVSVMGLSNEWTALNAKINAMTANGNTNWQSVYNTAGKL
jgi:hypothetical protein